MELSRKQIEDAVAQALQTLTPFSFERSTVSGGVTLIKANTVRPEPFNVNGQKIKDVFVTDVLTIDESPRLGVAVMEMHNSVEFPWTLRYDEVDYIVSGCLEIEINGQTVAGTQGDLIYIPKDSSIKFRAKGDVRFVCVMFPANWSEL